MLQVSEKYEKQILADNRSLRLKVECLYSLQGEVIHTLQGDDCIISMELEEMVNSEDVITMGSACCEKLTLKLIAASGRTLLPYTEEEFYQGLSAVVTVVVSLWSWWKNNSFTAKAIRADHARRK